MRVPSRTVAGYALLFSVPAGAGLGVAVRMTSGDPTLAALAGGAFTVVLSLLLVVVFGSGSTE
jgi:hypothetical protein